MGTASDSLHQHDENSSMVSCQKGPTRHSYAWKIESFGQDTLVIWWARQMLWNNLQVPGVIDFCFSSIPVCTTMIDWLNSFIFVIADNVQYRYKTQQYHTKHEDKMALVTKIS